MAMRPAIIDITDDTVTLSRSFFADLNALVLIADHHTTDASPFGEVEQRFVNSVAERLLVATREAYERKSGRVGAGEGSGS